MNSSQCPPGAGHSCLHKAPLPVLLLWYFWLRQLIEHLVMCSGNCSTILDKAKLKRPFCTQLVHRHLSLPLIQTLGISVLPVPGACTFPCLKAQSPCKQKEIILHTDRKCFFASVPCIPWCDKWQFRSCYPFCRAAGIKPTARAHVREASLKLAEL